jgi:hypothetical protein
LQDRLDRRAEEMATKRKAEKNPQWLAGDKRRGNSRKQMSATAVANEFSVA